METVDDRDAAEAALSVSVLARGDEARWDDFVRRSPSGTFYHLSGWRDIIESQLGHPSYYLVCEANGELQAILPLAHLHSMLFGSALISMPFLVYGGPVAASAEAAKRVIDYACELARELEVDQLELRNLRDEDFHGHADDWIRGSTHVTFRKSIDPDPDVNLKAVPRKQRAMIRKGMQAGLSWELDDDVSRLYPAMLECKRNLGTPFFGRRYLQAIKDRFGDQVEILTVLRKGETVCSVMSFRYADQILPYYGGGGDLARIYKGNDFMYWCVMEKAAREGVRTFDYGRSQVDGGAYRFKKHWGFEPEPLAYRHFLVKAPKLPRLNPSNPKYRLAIRLWQRLPLGVAALLGPPIAARLG